MVSLVMKREVNYLLIKTLGSGACLSSTEGAKDKLIYSQLICRRGTAS
jgi:hypothetical protein